MAKAVTRALEEERHLAVQAGTGTGKSLAYLVPAIRHAHATGGTVVVSTATIALQRQLVERDLPRLADALEPLLERRPTFAIQKGRNNYVCRHKLSLPGDVPEALIEEDDISWLGRHVKRVNEWAQETETGDRDDLEPGVPDLAWRQVSVTSSECLGAARCPHGEECFAELARERTRNVDLVVTNHALLAIDALADTDVLPEHDVVIIDEAHELDGRITSVATNEISARALTMASRRADKLGAEKGELETVVDDFAAAMNVETPGRWENISEAARGGFVAVRDALWHTREAIAKGPEGEADNEPETFAERENLKNHLGDLHDAIVRILGVFDEDDPTKHTDVVWLTRSERVGDSVSVAPLSVASLLRERLFGEHTVVLTSATLTIGGNFNAVAAAWGLPDGTWDGMDAGTPFNPRSSGILYTAAHLPAPGRDGLAAETLDEVAELITAAGGRTLGLFSSRRAAEQAAEAMRARLPFDILLQGGLDGRVGQRVRCQRELVSLRHLVVVAGRGCARLVALARHHRPHPLPPPRRPAAAGARQSRQRRGPLRVHGGLRHARRAAHGPGRGAASALGGRQGRRRGAGQPADHQALRVVPAQEPAGFLGDDRPRNGARCFTTPRRSIALKPRGAGGFGFGLVAIPQRVCRHISHTRPAVFNNAPR